MNKREIKREKFSAEICEASQVNDAKKPYVSPILTEYGCMAELTKGTGSGTVDLLSQQLTLNLNILFPTAMPKRSGF